MEAVHIVELEHVAQLEEQPVNEQTCRITHGELQCHDIGQTERLTQWKITEIIACQLVLPGEQGIA